MKTMRQNGFSFIEVLVVIGILALLVAAVVPMVDILLSRQRETETRAELSSWQEAILDYRQAEQAWPALLSDLIPEYIGGGYFAQDVLLDNWNNPYSYLPLDPLSAQIYSWGRDETDNSGDETDDIVLVVHAGNIAREWDEVNFKRLSEALSGYYEDIGWFPQDTGDDCEDLHQLVENTYGESGWNGPYVDTGLYPKYCLDGRGFNLSYQYPAVQGYHVCRLTNSINDTILISNLGFKERTLQNLDLIILSLASYVSDTNSYPTLLRNLFEEPDPPVPGWNGPYIPELILEGDSWQTAWDEEYLSTRGYVYSWGANHQDDSPNAPDEMNPDDIWR